jgi:hypothetical protein
VAYSDFQATIATPDGTFTDSGTAATTLRDLDGVGAFSESFLFSFGVEPAGPGPATALVIDPAAATNPVGTTHTVTASATDATCGRAADGTPILFIVRGSTETAGRCTTTAGQCQFSYQGPDLPGADSITACADNNGSGTCDVGEPAAEATKAWLLPASTPGQVTGGGQIPDPSDRNRKIAFGFTAQHVSGSLKGHCSVVDQSAARNIHIRCLEVTTLVQSGTHATFFGRATVDGVLTDYRIDVDDLDEPGRGHDTFKVRTSSGYTAAGVLTEGNIQVHG